MNIVPDLVPDLHPSMDLEVFFQSNPVEAGTFLQPDAVRVHFILLREVFSKFHTDSPSSGTQSNRISRGN